VAAALLLAAAIALALRAVEVNRFRPAAGRDPELVRAICLTIGPACGLLFAVILGAPISGESVAVGLFMAAGPLTLALAERAWRSLFRPLGATETPVEVARDWMGEWAEAERALAPEPAAVEAEVVPFPAPHRPAPLEPDWADDAEPRRAAAGR
jgi:hypothetical protein